MPRERAMRRERAGQDRQEPRFETLAGRLKWLLRCVVVLLALVVLIPWGPRAVFGDNTGALPGRALRRGHAST